MFHTQPYSALALSMRTTSRFRPAGLVVLVSLGLFMASLYARPVAIHPALGRLPIMAAGVAWLLFIIHLLKGYAPLVLGGKQAAAVYLLVLLSGASLAWSINQPETQSILMDFLRVAVIYLLTINVACNLNRVKFLAWAIVLGSAIPAQGTIGHYLDGIMVVGEEDRYAWLDIFLNPNYLAYGMAVAMPITLSLRELTRHHLARVLLVGLVVLQAIAITLSGSRGGMLGLGAGLISWLIFRPGYRVLRALPFAAGLALLALITAPSLTWDRFSTGFSTESRDLSFQTRLYAWEVGFRVVQDRPLGGSGSGTFETAWPIYAPLEFGDTYYTAHNSYIQAMAELGLTGLIFLLSALILGMISLLGLRKAGGERGILSSGLAGGLVAFMVCSMGGGHLYSWYPYLVLALVESLTIWGGND